MKFNPLARLDERALEGMVRDGHRYFVRQTFNRGIDGFDTNVKGCFLFCHYKDLPKAKEHYDVLDGDPNRFLYDWENEAHRKKLRIAAAGPEGYKIYTNTLVPDWEKYMTDRVKQKIRAYIMKLGWKPTREEAVTPVLYPHFGEICVSLRFRKQEVRVTFEEIEKAF
jgi:hypothetical protein